MPHLRPAVPLPDGLLAVALTAVGVVDTARHSAMLHPVTELWVLVAIGAIALRSRMPLAMCGIASLGLVGYALMPEASTPLWGFVTILVLAFSAGANLGGRRRVTGVGALLAAAYVVQVVTSTRLPADQLSWGDVWVTPVVLTGVPALAGGLLRRSRDQARALQELAIQLDTEREQHATAAAAGERNRIARELHDVISHSVSVMVVQAGAAENLLPSDSPALEPVRRVRSTGREALAELRRQLGLLRGTAPGRPDPMPGLGGLRALAQAMDADLEVSGDLDTLESPGLELAAYRVVQEGLTNARRHANDGPVSVRVARRAGALEVTVLDTGGGPGGTEGGGHGLQGMRERVALYGGEVDAGPRADAHGWRLFARLPVDDR